MYKGKYDCGARAVSGARTRDLRLGKPMLYQLSYYRTEKRNNRYDYEPIMGLEPMTYALRMRCSTN